MESIIIEKIENDINMPNEKIVRIEKAINGKHTYEDIKGSQIIGSFKEGDVLIKEGNKYKVDSESTLKRKENIITKLNKIFKK